MTAVQITLRTGHVATVDSADLPTIEGYLWYGREDGHTAYATGRKAGKRGPLVAMHRLLLGFPDEDVDHVDGNGLNNTRANLRVASRWQNNANARPRSGCTSVFKGVSWDRQRSRWRAYKYKGRRVQLGSFRSEHEAAQAYDAAADIAFGEFARLNLPNEART